MNKHKPYFMQFFKNHKLHWSFLLCSTFPFLQAEASGGEEPLKQKPNVLFIAVDDMNDWISPLGGIAGLKTPNLERLAGMSMTFTNAHCASPASAPSRLSVMTGVHPARSGIATNVWYDGPEWRNNPELKEVQTIEQFFGANGYENLAGGKLYHSLAPPWLVTNQAEPDNWDFWFPSPYVPMPYQVRAEPSVIFPENTVGERPNPYFTWGALQHSDEKMIDYQLVDWAKYELNRKRDKPLFMAVGLFRPHMPWEVPQKYFDLYPLETIPDLVIRDDDLNDAFDHGRRHWHQFVLDNHQWKHVLQAYMASISFADAQLGRLLDALEESPYRDNTIIVLWSDHGMHMGEKENWEKFTLWEESTRVPLFISAPGITIPGSTCSAPVSLVDIYPTLAELIGEKPPRNCDGESLVPILSNRTTSHDPVIIAYEYEFGRGTGYAVRSDRYRYIYYPTIGLEELYDHKNDPQEFHNIAYKKEQKQIVKQHREALAKKVAMLQWSEKAPKGYTIQKDGSIRKNDFVLLKDK